MVNFNYTGCRPEDSIALFQSLKGILVNFNTASIGHPTLPGSFNPSKGFW
ncbi:hypothetical protein CKA32_001390 [Geitlerinema sp. FC II]|nr:hypothetical protein CKA32_001390 [Geitlerinema sp. FC II]